MNDNKSGLKKVLGKWDVLALGFGAMIGWGWLSMGGYWISTAGSLGACLSFAVAGLMIIFVGLAFCELSSAMPKAGGVMNYTWRAFGPKVSFFSAWMLTLGYVAMTAWEGIATVAAVDFLFPTENGSALYSVAGQDVYLLSLVIALVAAAIMFFLPSRGIDTIAKFQNASIVIMVVVVIIFAVFAFIKGDVHNLEPTFPNGIKGSVSIMLMCVLFLGGFDTIPQVAEEMNLPRKMVGKLVLTSILLALLWYFITILATAISLTQEQLGGATLAAGTAMGVVFGSEWAGKLLVVSGILGILTSWVALYIGATRLLFGMARVGMLPEAFSKLHPKYNTPHVATCVVGVLTFIAPFFGRQALQWLSNAGGWAINLGFGMAALSFLVLRFKEPDMERPYRVPCGKVVGFLAVAMSFTLVIMCLPGVSTFSLVWPHEAGIVIAWFVVGAILFALSNKTGRFKNVDKNIRQVVLGDQAEK